MKTVITNAGINACIQAGLMGPKVTISTVKIGSSITTPSVEMSDVVNQVWAGNTTYIQYQLVDDRTFLFKITLDESIGDFNIGNIGLFLEDGTMFSLTTLDKVETKVKNAEEVIGNRRIFEIPFVLSGISGLMDVTLLVPDESSIPFLQTEADLPDYTTAPYSIYEIIFHSQYRTACLALRTPSGWSFIQPASSDTSISFYEGLFGSDVLYGDLVYWNSGLQRFLRADGGDDSKGYIGIRTTLNSIVNSGVYVNTSWNLTSGVDYYAGTGQYIGKLTATKNNWFVGTAIDSHTILLGTKSESTLNKVNTLNMSNPSNIKYPSEAAVVSSISDNFAKKDMSNVGDVTFTGNVTFSNIIQGTALRTLWGDLAENYEMDDFYPLGTLVQFGGSHEMTIATTEVNAVISSKPGLVLNTFNPGQPIALTGKVPVRIKGKVEVFDYIELSDTPGIGQATKSKEKAIGRALVSKDSDDIDLVMCSVMFKL